jgi:agmatinase
MMDLLKRIIDGRNVLGFDVVELCPQPGNPAPDFTAAKLVYKVMGLALSSSANQGEDRESHGKKEV